VYNINYILDVFHPDPASKQSA